MDYMDYYLLLICRPWRDVRLSWPNWLTRQFTHGPAILVTGLYSVHLWCERRDGAPRTTAIANLAFFRYLSFACRDCLSVVGATINKYSRHVTRDRRRRRRRRRHRVGRKRAPDDDGRELRMKQLRRLVSPRGGGQTQVWDGPNEARKFVPLSGSIPCSIAWVLRSLQSALPFSWNITSRLRLLLLGFYLFFLQLCFYAFILCVLWLCCFVLIITVQRESKKSLHQKRCIALW